MASCFTNNNDNNNNLTDKGAFLNIRIENCWKKEIKRNKRKSKKKKLLKLSGNKKKNFKEK